MPPPARHAVRLKPKRASEQVPRVSGIHVPPPPTHAAFDLSSAGIEHDPRSWYVWK